MPTTTTIITVPGALKDVGILQVKALKKVKVDKTEKVEIEVRNFSNTTQTRSVSLSFNGIDVSGSPQSVTLKGQTTVVVKFKVLFSTPGTGALQASLFPADANPTNDMKTVIVRVGDKDKDKNKDK